jgi:hypothetical protein
MSDNAGHIDDHESQLLRELQDADAERSAQAYKAAQAMRAADMPANIGLTTGPRGKDLVALRSMYDTLGTMLVGPKEEYDWQQTRRHLRILISRWEMDSAGNPSAEQASEV